MLEELQRWPSLSVWKRMPEYLAIDAIDARWALKWKNIGDEWCIQARVFVRLTLGPTYGEQCGGADEVDTVLSRRESDFPPRTLF